MLKQNTPEWLEMRKSHIGASDAPVIMQSSPYKTPFQLWEEKLDLAPSALITQRMQRGHDLEEAARQELEKMTGMFFLPQVKFHAKIPYMMASLDAIDAESKCIAEIKCPGEKDHTLALSGQVPDKYFPQLQHQLEVCELEMGYYFSFTLTHDGENLQKYIANTALVKVHRDDKYIKKMLQKEQEFWECMQSWIAPEMTERDFDQKTDELWCAAASEWRHLNFQMKELEEKENHLRQTIIAMSQKRNSIGAGIKVSRIIRKGNVDYSVIPELQDVELEKYRKKSIESYKITAA